MDLNAVWQDYGLDQLEAGVSQLFPENRISVGGLLEQVMAGDILGALSGLFSGIAGNLTAQASGYKNLFLWLLLLGIASSLVVHFVEVFDMHQVADLSFYFMYLLFTAILLKCFAQAAETAAAALENITLFIRMLAPAYLLATGVSGGSVTAGVTGQLMLLVIYGVECILGQLILPLVYSFVMLSLVNGIWAEEKLTLLLDLLAKGIGWILKGALGIITGVSIFQALITPVVDSVRKSALQKVISAIPGVGNVADGALELVLGSALVIRNSVGVVLLLLMLALCAAPLLKIGVLAAILKCAAAFLGLVSDRRITLCANRAGDAGLMLLRTTGTAMLLFLISVAVAAAAARA
ncbi:MAG: stage III sporulation protein AE [Roseburia sp.]|nr:stage III sporulation protein AE [Roseburia sp.]MCM1098325.1 stage III sporulation protein AE [Ruminococcus flavefaciens]